MLDLKYLPHGDRLISGKLLADLTAIATTTTVDNPPTAAKLPTYFEFEYGTDDAEVVRVINVSGSTITIERGINSGGTGKAHSQNDLYKEKITNYAWNKVVDAIENGYLTEDTSYAFAKVTTGSFKITAAGVDRTGFYTAGRRVRLNGSIVVHISSSSYSNPDTTVVIRETTVPATITSVEIEIGTKGNFVDIENEHNSNGTHKSSIVTLTGTQTLTNKRITKRILSATNYTTDTGTSLNCDNLDMFIVTAQVGDLKFNNPTGTPTEGQTLWIAVTGTGARALTYDTQFEASAGVALPTTTVLTNRLDIGFVWRADTSKWHCVASS